jgi:hypothetical protein
MAPSAAEAVHTDDRALALRDAARWFTLGISSIAVAGTLAIVLVIGRLPGVAEIVITDVEFARRSLVVHVNLALGVWFFSFMAGLFCLLPGARGRRVTPLAFALATLGVIAFSISMFLPGATPILSNYVPALDHPVFVGGLSLFWAGVALNFVDRRFVPRRTASIELPAECHTGVRAAAIAFVLALGTIGATWATQPDGLTAYGHYERLFWGGGHLLQYANVLAMVSAWLLLLSHVLPRPPIAPRVANVLFLLLLAPTLSGPVLAATSADLHWYTKLMQWGIFPMVSVFIVLIWAGFFRNRGQYTWRSPAFMGLITSVGMTVLGFLLGAMISTSTTLIPAHYHTSIGAVTAAFMAVTLTLLPRYGRQLRPGAMRWAIWQPALFGLGQVVFAFGLAIAGTWGQAERKVYGKEQVVRTTGEWVGLIVMGAGGVIALVGGILFVVLLVKALRNRVPAA